MSNYLLFGYDHPFSQQLRITLHSSTWELLDVSVDALAWFLSFVLILSQELYSKNIQNGRGSPNLVFR